MATFLLFGKYSQEALKGISADRTQKAQELIKQSGGSVKSMYVLLGQHDLVLIVDLPKAEDAIKTSIALTKSTGISFSTFPALTVEEFDKIASA